MLGSQLTIFIIAVIWIIIIVLLFREVFNLKNKLKKSKYHNNSNLRQLTNQNLNQPRQYDSIKNYDMKKLYDPLEEPVKRPDRYVLGDVNMRKYFNIPTQGYPDNFRLLGLLISEDKHENNFNNSNNDSSQENNIDDKISQIAEVNSKGFNAINPNKILKLYGRQKYPGSNTEYEYYTSITTGNEMTKIHISDRRELYTGDTIYIPELQQNMKVELYPNDELRYNPFII